jgi:hypothetical protein
MYFQFCRTASKLPKYIADVAMPRSRARSSSRPVAPRGVNVGSLLVLVGGAFAVFAALLARQGFTGRDHGTASKFLNLFAVSLTTCSTPVVGIDLGTTYSVVAISQKNNVTAIADGQGHILVPSTVAFLPRGGPFQTRV